MASERFFGRPASVATDVYELAVVLYVMLAGRLPWDVLSDPEVRVQPRALVEVASVAEALDVEVRRALLTRAQNRPASARALYQAVRAAASASAAAPEPAETARMRSAATLRPELDSVFGDNTGSAIGKLEVVVDHTVVRVRGNLTSLMLGIVNAAIGM